MTSPSTITALANTAAGLTEALNGAFEDVGWLSDDGIGEELSGSKTKYRGHQGMAVIRTRMEEGGTLVQARDKTWAPLIFQDLFKQVP